MTRKRTCGHKAGSNCIICADANDMANLDVVRHQALVNKLIDLGPRFELLLALGGDVASNLFIDALDLSDAKADSGTVRRMAKQTICAVATAADMVRLAQPPGPGQGGYTHERQPHWTPGQVLSAQLLTAQANRDTAMVADLLVAAINGKTPLHQLEVLCDVLFHTVIAASEARQLAYARNGATP